MYSTGEADIDIEALLTPLEFQIISLHFNGYSYREIAHSLQISKSCVYYQMRHIREKLLCICGQLPSNVTM